tara:strand:+ start:1944 stop:3566 length:1623 start_codon:yes stop_codon:yes gene_type:complete
MEHLILKGQGVTFDDPETGERHMMSFPFAEGQTEYGLSHAVINPFFIHPKTGELLDQREYPHRWPIEGLAVKAAQDYMKKFPGTDYHTALSTVKAMLNKSVDMFNEHVRRHGDSRHALPHYFDENGHLNPDWGRVNYGTYQVKATPTESRRTKNADGVVTFHPSSKPLMIGEQNLGLYPESGAFPTWEFFKKQMDELQVPSDTVLNPHVDPQQMVIPNTEGVKSPVTRHLSTHPSPMSEYGMTHAEKGQRQHLHVDQILAGLDPIFFTEKRATEGTHIHDAQSNLMSQGLHEAVAGSVAQSAVGSFFNRGPVKGTRDGVSTAMTRLTQRVQERTQMAPEQILSEMQKYVRAYQASGIEDRSIHHENASVLMQALALSEVARQVGAHTESEPTLAREGMRHLTRNAAPPRLIPQEAPERTMDMSHVNGEQQIPPYIDLTSLAQEPTLGPGRSDGEGLGEIRASQNNIAQLMEHLQMADARLDDTIMKAVSEVDNVATLTRQFGLSAHDITLIRSARGDWDRLAKTLMLEPHVVKVVKLSLR